MWYQIILAAAGLFVVYILCCGIKRLARKCVIPVKTVDAKADNKTPLYPEAYPSFFNTEAGKLPYVYHSVPFTQTARTITYRSPYLGIDQTIRYCPRNKRGKDFDNVRGIAVSENLTLLREIVIHDMFPGDIREICKHFSGRLPTEAEIKQIFEKKAMICNNLLECGEPLLQDRRYLYTCGDALQDDLYNYCLHFATGETHLADCDDYVSAFLVE